MISVIQKDDKYQIRFPYNKDILSMVKSTPSRRWHPEEKFWDIDLKFLGFFLNQTNNSVYADKVVVKSDEDINENDSIDFTPHIPDVDVSEITYRIADGCKPLPHQIDSMKYFLDRKRRGLRSGFILADQMGCAKTAQVMNMALYNKEYEDAKHCLVVCCVNSAKYNWVEDIKKHTNGEYVPYILGSRLRRDGTLNQVGGGKEKVQDLQTMRMYGGKGDPLPYFIVVNIEAFRTKDPNNSKKFIFSDEVIKLVNSGEINMIALDEVHKNCFTYDTLIQTNLGPVKIGDIVRSKLKLDVLSYDLDRGCLVYKPIVDWHSYVNQSSIIELVIQEGEHTRTIRCTPDHEIYTRNRGWVKAVDLSEDDDIVFELGDKNDNKNMSTV